MRLPRTPEQRKARAKRSKVRRKARERLMAEREATRYPLTARTGNQPIATRYY